MNLEFLAVLIPKRVYTFPLNFIQSSKTYFNFFTLLFSNFKITLSATIHIWTSILRMSHFSLKENIWKSEDLNLNLISAL